MGDRASQACVKARVAQFFKDTGKGATVGPLVTPVEVACDLRIGDCEFYPAFVGHRATSKAPRPGTNTWEMRDRWNSPTGVKQRWAGGRLCRERAWGVRRQRYGSQVGGRRKFSGGTLGRTLVGLFTQLALDTMYATGNR